MKIEIEDHSKCKTSELIVPPTNVVIIGTAIPFSFFLNTHTKQTCSHNREENKWKERERFERAEGKKEKGRKEGEKEGTAPAPLGLVTVIALPLSCFISSLLPLPLPRAVVEVTRRREREFLRFCKGEGSPLPPFVVSTRTCRVLPSPSDSLCHHRRALKGETRDEEKELESLLSPPLLEAYHHAELLPPSGHRGMVELSRLHVATRVATVVAEVVWSWGCSCRCCGSVERGFDAFGFVSFDELR
ncbi:uncharacterized protein DS421_7g218310 [Arachis hypogaea]|nr:uncharacterized protein DS421_7g218310 [Arachis hypogaea]